MAIDMTGFDSIMQKTFKENGLSKVLSYEKMKQFTTLAEFLLEENEKYNLTAIKEPGKVALLHFADCVSMEANFPKNAKVIDVGCGAGFPTLPLAIARPDLEILAVDSTEKKIRFVQMAVEKLGLTNVKTQVLRAEDGAKEEPLRESFDIATARAVSEMRVLSELCLPYVKIGGSFLAMKGKNVQYELQNAKKALSLLGGKLIAVDETPLKSSVYGEQSHALVKVQKEKKTPQAYPRVYAQITKKPL